MARLISERHIRELINRYGGNGGGTYENLGLWPFMFKVGTSNVGGTAAIYFLNELNDLNDKKAIMILPGNLDDTRPSYEWSGVYSGKRYVQFFMPSLIEHICTMYFVNGTYPVYALGDNLNSIPCDSIENRLTWWNSVKGESLGNMYMNTEIGMIGTLGEEISVLTNPLIRDMIVVTTDKSISGRALAAEISLDYSTEVNNTLPRPNETLISL